jgi:small GTP-binding protein
MPINAHPDYLNAEARYNQAQTTEEQVIALEEMIRFLPTHKGAENLRKNIKTRYKKLKTKLIASKKKSGKQEGIRKGDMQTVLLGLTNSGKSSIFKALTGKDTKIASYGFTTNKLNQGILNYLGSPIQIIDTPPIASENFDSSIINTADTILIVAEKLHEIPDLKKVLKKSSANQIIAFNKIDCMDFLKTLREQKYGAQVVSSQDNKLG